MLKDTRPFKIILSNPKVTDQLPQKMLFKHPMDHRSTAQNVVQTFSVIIDQLPKILNQLSKTLYMYKQHPN